MEIAVPFIPYNQDAANKLRQEMSNHPFFKDPETFVAIFNQGFLNKRDDEIMRLLGEIESAFKDVKVDNRLGVITMLSDSEVFLEDAVLRVEAWASVLRTIRKVQDHINAGKLGKDATLHFFKDKSRVTVSEVLRDEEGNTVDGEALMTLSNSDLEAVSAVEGAHATENGVVVPVGVLLRVGDQFLRQVAGSIPPIRGRHEGQ
jgi:hypothetical protein